VVLVLLVLVLLVLVLLVLVLLVLVLLVPVVDIEEGMEEEEEEEEEEGMEEECTEDTDRIEEEQPTVVLVEVPTAVGGATVILLSGGDILTIPGITIHCAVIKI